MVEITKAKVIPYGILLLSCLVMFGNYYSYNIPSSINNQLRLYLGTEYAEYQFQINQLYSAYSAPNIFMPLVGGLLVDKLGNGRMLIIFGIFVLCGQIIFAFGVLNRLFGVMLCGRVLLGLGGESLEVAQSSLTTDWFYKRPGLGLGFAFAVNLSFGRLSTALSDNLSPIIAEDFGVPVVSFVAVAVCVFSLVVIITILIVDRPRLRKLCSAGEYNTSKDQDGADSSNSSTINAGSGGIEDVVAPDLSYSSKTDGDATKNIDQPKQIVEIEADTEPSLSMDDQQYTGRFRELRGLPFSFWLLTGITVTLYGATISFMGIATDFLEQVYYVGDPKKSAFAMSMPTIISAIGSPVMGLLFDLLPEKTIWLPISSLLVLLAYVLFLLGQDALVSMVLMGIGYTVFPSAIWPIVPSVVRSSQVATSYGILYVTSNMARFVIPFIVAYVRTVWIDTFDPVLYLFLTLSLIGCLCSIALFIQIARKFLKDRRRKN